MMAVRRGSLAGALVLTLAGVTAGIACSGVDNDDRPPPAPGCTTNCGGPSGSGGPGTGGSGTGGNGTGGANLGGATSVTDITGTVVALADGTFEQAAAFTGSATVFAESRTGAPTMAGDYDGTSFTLANVPADRSVWVAVRPEDTAAFMDTFSYVDTTESNVTATVMSRSVLQEIAANLATSAEIDTSAAQIVVRVFEASGVGVSGVTASTTAGTFVAYSGNGTFSETETVTDNQGLIVIGNVPTSAFPGTEFVLRLGGAVDAEASIRIARGFATFVNVVVVP